MIAWLVPDNTRVDKAAECSLITGLDSLDIGVGSSEVLRMRVLFELVLARLRESPDLPVSDNLRRESVQIPMIWRIFVIQNGHLQM
ncbi:hypothetical protein [Xanthomonas axonopodis]